MATSTNDSDGAFDESKDEGKSEVTFEQSVNDAAVSMTQDDDGLWHLPDDHGLSEEVAYAAGLEKRRRDTQSAAAKTSQKLEASVERSDKLESKLKENFVHSLTKDQQEELEDLKSSDPDAYREKYNEYEAVALEAFEEELADMGYDDDQVSEMADRNSQLTEFLDANPGLTLDDEVMENDLPPRLVKQLDEGSIDFKKFLEESKKFLTSTKIDKDDGNDDEPNLSKAGGGSEASNKAIKGENDSSYKNVVF